MTDEDITSIYQLNIHNLPQLPSNSIVRSYQSIYHSRLNIQHSITKLLQNVLNEFESLGQIKTTQWPYKVHRIIVDILSKLYLTLKRWEKNVNNKVSIVLFLLRKLNDDRNQFLSQRRYYKQIKVNSSQNNKATNLISQLEQTMQNLQNRHNLEIMDYNKQIMLLKFDILYFKRGIVFFDTNSTTNQGIDSGSPRPKTVMFYKWVDKLREYFLKYLETEKQETGLSKSFNNWTKDLKLFRTISLLNLRSWVNINFLAKNTNVNSSRNQYINIIHNVKDYYRHLLDRIVLDVDQNRNIYGEKCNYNNYINELDNVLKTKLLDKIVSLKNLVDSYKARITYDFEKIEKLQKSLEVYSDTELINQNTTLNNNLKLLIKNFKFWKVTINRIEWIIATKENILNDMILESKINLEKQKISSERIKKQKTKIKDPLIIKTFEI